MHREVVPAILAKSMTDFWKKLGVVARVAHLVQIDVMDGKFVPNRTRVSPSLVQQQPYTPFFEVHLMVYEPYAAVAAWGEVAKVSRIIVHVEAARDVGALIRAVRDAGKRVGLAINPSTPLRTILPHLRTADMVLVMANDPGFSGRPFRASTLRRIAAIRRRFPDLHIGVDIGVNRTTAPLLRKAGATHIAAASAIFNAPDPVAAYHELERVFGAA